ncbi:MAG: hypothetical protein ACM339_06665 [Ignavibacteria bacterium]
MKSRYFLTVLMIVNLLMFIFLMGGLSSSSADDQKILKIRGLEMIDENGLIRSSLRLEPEGEVILRFFDNKGEIRFKAGASEKGSGLLLINNLTNPGVQIIAKDIGTSLKLIDKNGKEKLIEP